MKKLFLRLGLLTALTLAMFSCDKQEQHQNLIPKDADIVLAINPAQIAEKAQLSSDENLALIKKAVSLTAGTKLEQQLQELIKNPEKSGVDFDAPIYASMGFSSKKKHEPEFVTLSFKLKSEDDLKALFFNLDENIKLDEGEIAGFKTFKPQGVEEFILATKDNQALLFGGELELHQTKLKAILEQSTDTSFASTEVFAKMNESKDDFEGVINYGAFLSSPMFKALLRGNPIQAELMEESLKDYSDKNFFYIFGLNAEKGALKLNTEVYSESERLQDMLEDSEEVMPKSDGEFLELLPKNSLFAFNFSLDGEKLLDFIKEYYPNGFAKMQELEKEKLSGLVTVEDVLKAFDGDITFSLSGSLIDFQQEKVDIRTFVELGDTEVAVKLMDLFAQENPSKAKLSKLAENQYFLDVDIPIRFGLKDDVFFFGTRQVNSVDELFEEAKPSIKESSFADKLADKRVSTVINISEIVSLAKPFLGFFIPSSEAINKLEQIDYLAIDSEDVTKAEMVLKLKNEQTPYALLLDFVRDTTAKFK